MKAIVQDTYGSADVLELRDIDTPVAGDTQVLVRIHAASINASDWYMMAGLPYLVRLGFGVPTPKIKVRGHDLAGEVVAVGSQVTRFQPGDLVFGATNGAFGEYACAPEDKLTAKPASVTFAQAAAVPVAALTALQGLRDHGNLQSGQRVLVIGASGGVGSFAVQIAKALGAEVTDVCSTTNVELVSSIGADRVIDYMREDFTDTDRRYDLLLDIRGTRPLSKCLRLLDPGGGTTCWLEGHAVVGSDRWLPCSSCWCRSRSWVPGCVTSWRTSTGGPIDTLGSHDLREGHAGHRPHLPTGRGAGRNPVLGNGSRSGQGGH